jgi:hypothetical protein
LNINGINWRIQYTKSTDTVILSTWVTGSGPAYSWTYSGATRIYNDYDEIIGVNQPLGVAYGNPNNWDTDSDGICDNWEARGYPYLIPTPGSMTCSPQIAYTNPRFTNTDVLLNSPGDSIPDGQELAFYDYATDTWNPFVSDPTKKDSDLDGLNDDVERFGYLDTGKKSYPFRADSDLDYVPDNIEDMGKIVVTGGQTYTFMSNPLLIDSDGDGLTDRQEMYAEVPGSSFYSYPDRADSDGDGVYNDYQEHYETRTNPLKTDGDDDGFSDITEVGIPAYLNPNSYNSNPTKIRKTGFGTWTWSSGSFAGSPSSLTINDNVDSGSSGFTWSSVTVGAHWGYLSDPDISSSYRNRISTVHILFESRSTRNLLGTTSNLRYWIKVQVGATSYQYEVSVIPGTFATSTYLPFDVAIPPDAISKIKYNGGYIKEAGVKCTGTGWGNIFGCYTDYLWIDYWLTPNGA